MIAALVFPTSTAPLAEGSNRLIAGQRLGVGVAMLLDFGVLARRNDRMNRCPLLGRGQRLEHLAFVIGPIAAQRLHGGLDLCQQRLHLPRIIVAIRRQGLRDDLAGGFINPEGLCCMKTGGAVLPLSRVIYAFLVIG